MPTRIAEKGAFRSRAADSLASNSAAIKGAIVLAGTLRATSEFPTDAMVNEKRTESCLTPVPPIRTATISLAVTAP